MKQKLGVLTFALGREYERYAAKQAKSWEQFDIPVTVVVDNPGDVHPDLSALTSLVSLVPVPKGILTPFAFEALSFGLSPYEVTLKTDADLVIPRGSTILPSWANNFSVLSGVPTDAFGKVHWKSPYRAEWRKHLDLPEVHSAFFYFDKSPLSEKFFVEVSNVFEQYYVSDLCKIDRIPSTDLAYSIAWLRVFGQSTLREGLPFLHGKAQLTGLYHHTNWTSQLAVSVSQRFDVSINGVSITLPFHYQDKSFCDYLP